MTSNQIAYWSNEEQKRSNRVQEFERNRSNLATEEELLRHNQAQEQNEYQKLQEAARANRERARAQELQHQRELVIAAENRATNERIAQLRNQAELLKARILARQQERANLLNATLTGQKIRSSERIAASGRRSAETIAAHNRAVTAADNFERRVNERIRLQQEQAKVTETHRSNIARESSHNWQNVVNAISNTATFISAIGKLLPK